MTTYPDYARWITVIGEYDSVFIALAGLVALVIFWLWYSPLLSQRLARLVRMGSVYGFWALLLGAGLIGLIQ